jgi:hypothetical protein
MFDVADCGTFVAVIILGGGGYPRAPSGALHSFRYLVAGALHLRAQEDAAHPYNNQGCR